MRIFVEQRLQYEFSRDFFLIGECGNKLITGIKVEHVKANNDALGNRQPYKSEDYYWMAYWQALCGEVHGKSLLWR